MVIHLTLCGNMAGYVLCQQPKNDQDQYQHAIYADLTQASVCQDCLAVWQDDSEEAYHDPTKNSS